MSWVSLLQIYLVFYAMDIAHAEGDACTEDSVILDGDTFYSGLVLLCKDEQWTPVCDRRFGEEEMQVICRQLRLPGIPVDLSGTK